MGDETVHRSGDGGNTNLHVKNFFPRAVHQKGEKRSGLLYGTLKMKLKKGRRKD